MNANQVKEILFSLGADLCGIASLDRFDSAPRGYHPTDVFPMCKSVISFACRFPVSTLACNSHVPYTLVRNGMTAKMDAIALSFCTEMEKQGVLCVPIPTNDSQWDEAAGRWRSIVSQKHAAQAAGLGTIGRHSLLITPEFGSMVWLGCVLCSLALEPDGMKEPVCTDCGLCAASCPAHALDGGQVNQQACWDHAFGEDKVLKTWVISCHRCRDVCPYNFGTENENLLPRARTMSAPIDVTNIRIETPRLVLRPMAMEDLSDFHEYASDPEVTVPSGWKAHRTSGESREHLEKMVSSKDCLALVLKENGKMVGNIALQIRDWSQYPLKSTLRGREYGFELNRAYWGRGLMPEAVMAVTEYCFQTLRYDFVTGGHFAENGKSARAIQKCGFTFLFDGKQKMDTGREEQIRTYIRYNPYREGQK